MANDLMNNRNNWMDFEDDSFFNQFANRFFHNDLRFPSFSEKSIMKTDVSENDKEYTVEIDLPGIKKENIQINYEDGILSVSGKQERETEARNNDNEVIHSERYYGSYSRQYRLPNVERENIKAKYDGGVLTISLPKAQNSERSHSIQID